MIRETAISTALAGPRKTAGVIDVAQDGADGGVIIGRTQATSSRRAGW